MQNIKELLNHRLEEKWHRSPRGEAYAAELISTTPINLDHQVEYLPMKTSLTVSEQQHPWTFTTASQRKVWNSCYDVTNMENPATFIDHNAYVSGSMGVGKSRSIAYFLKKLLENNKFVCFTNAAELRTYAFFPMKQEFSSSNNTPIYQVYYCIFEKRFDNGLVNNEYTYHILDDIHFESNSLLIYNRAKTVAVGKPHNRFDSWMRDMSVKNRYIISPWKRAELEQIRPFINVKSESYNNKPLTRSELDQRFYEFGGAPKILFANFAEYKWRQLEFKDAIRSCIDKLDMNRYFSDDLVYLEYMCQKFNEHHIVSVYNDSIVPIWFTNESSMKWYFNYIKSYTMDKTTLVYALLNNEAEFKVFSVQEKKTNVRTSFFFPNKLVSQILVDESWNSVGVLVEASSDIEKVLQTVKFYKCYLFVPKSIDFTELASSIELLMEKNESVKHVSFFICEIPF